MTDQTRMLCVLGVMTGNDLTTEMAEIQPIYQFFSQSFAPGTAIRYLGDLYIHAQTIGPYTELFVKQHTVMDAPEDGFRPTAN